MISWMQKHRKYLVVTIWISTIAFVGAGFVGWGAYSFSENKADSVAQVGNRTITGKDLQSSYNNIYGYYNQLLGGKLTQEKANELKLEDIAREQLIQEALLLNYADDLGITATGIEIVKKLHSIDNFKKDGVFDKEIYFKVLKSIRKDATTFEEDLKKELIVTKLKKALDMPYTLLELETLGASIYLQDKINAKVIEIKDADINITDGTLKSYWSDNKTRYLSEKSYTVETIKILSADITVEDNELLEFYNDKKHLFKSDDDKIIKFEDAKTQVTSKLQLKKAKKEALKKYLAFKDGKITDTKIITLTQKDSIIPLEKIVNAKVGSYIKAIELEDGYMTARLNSINEPKALLFEDAKNLAQADLLLEKKAELLKEKVELNLKDLNGTTDLGFLTKKDSGKVTILDDNEAKSFLNYLFSKSDKKGSYLLRDKAIVYEITDQKLVSAEQLKTNKDELIKNIEAIKKGSLQTSLIEKLRTKYLVEIQ